MKRPPLFPAILVTLLALVLVAGLAALFSDNYRRLRQMTREVDAMEFEVAHERPRGTIDAGR